MGKLKTHKGVAARIKITGTGKVRRFRTGKRHLLTGKKASRKRNLRKPTGLPRSSQRMLKSLLA